MNATELNRPADAVRQEKHISKIRRGLSEEISTILPDSVSSRGAVTLPGVVGWSYDDVKSVSPYLRNSTPKPGTVSVVHGMLRLSLEERKLTLTPFDGKDRLDPDHTIDLVLTNSDRSSTYLGWPDQVLSRDGMQIVGAVLWGDSNPQLHRDVILVRTGEVRQSDAPSVDTLKRVVEGLRKLQM